MNQAISACNVVLSLESNSVKQSIVVGHILSDSPLRALVVYLSASMLPPTLLLDMVCLFIVYITACSLLC